MKPTPLFGHLVLAVMLLAWPNGAARAQPAKADAQAPWGQPRDGIACRVFVQPSYVIGQLITVHVEVKNTSNKKRYLCVPPARRTSTC